MGTWGERDQRLADVTWKAVERIPEARKVCVGLVQPFVGRNRWKVSVSTGKEDGGRREGGSGIELERETYLINAKNATLLREAESSCLPPSSGYFRPVQFVQARQAERILYLDVSAGDHVPMTTSTLL